MSRAAVLRAGRREAARGLVDACLITRVVGSTTDKATLVRTEDRDTVYEGPCRVQELLAFSRDTTPSPDVKLLGRYRILQLPVVDSEGIQIGDDVEITACVNDPDLVGKTMRVRDQSGKSEATTRRVGIEEMTG
jgi:hypothetical protein